MKNLLCFGDSNTYGYAPETKLRYDFSERWTGILSRSLLPLGVHVDEEGLCGRTTDFDDLYRPGRKGSDVLPILLESHTPGYVIIMLGTNDCKSSYKNSPDDIAAGVEKLVRQVREYNGNVKILIVSPIHLAEGVGEKGYDEAFDENSVRVSRGLREAYLSVAKKTGCDFLAASEYASPSVADREHLDRTGHRQLARAIFGKIREAV
ncbi:MAG: GDSL-type esterase/lipase family protein [Oscillospiraceae bacterium]|nr:GDSL-type esterase/lipase family protein [Oscillospiraceae bacterium]MDY6208612.1 GDSL-type esterase/lipase family protein [Oscillospiraceae bacterium]